MNDKITEAKITIMAIRALAEWALKENPPPPLSVIAACDRILNRVQELERGAEDYDRMKADYERLQAALGEND
jgi:hypothetical protein